jgi:sortase (surface protein transpeptidase)
VEAVSFPAHIRAAIKRYLKWYSFPLTYFLLTSLICAYAWYTRPIPYRAGIKAVFKTIALNPTLILTGIITVWIILAIISIPLVLWLKKKFPSQKKDILQELSSHNKPTSFRGKTVNVSISVLGVVLIVAGLSIALWIARPYITFLFSTSKIETLEKKAELLGQVQRDEINKSGALEKKTEISAQVQEHETKKSAILGKTAVSQEVAQRDSIKKIEALDTTAEVPERVQRNAIKKSGALERRSSLFELVRRDAIKSTMENQTGSEATEKTLEKSAKIPGQAQEDRMIIPTALVDAEILDGVSTENLSLGVCRILKSAKPGQKGNCIIEGHNLGDFKWWRPQGPFNMIEVLEKGVHIYIFYKGKKYIYKVKEKHYKDANDPKLYDFRPGERLTLITCTSTWNPSIDSGRRTVIVAYPQ